MQPNRKKFLAILILGCTIVILSKSIFWIGGIVRTTGLTPSILFRLVFDNGAQLKSKDGRTNLLILGIGGGTHAGADLTDTMMVLSVDTASKTNALISIPRDIWSETLKDRINSAYHYGEEKQKGGGLILSKVLVEDVVGIPVHYALVLDFSGFRKVIDEVGGIDVNVTRAFTDPNFPIEGKENDTCPGDPENRCLYKTVQFEAGVQHMDGERALTYARSRQSEGDEGSDFARSRRQQDIILALKDKFLHPFSWVTRARISALPHVLDEATDMDLTLGEAITIGKLYITADENTVQRISIEDKLVTPPSYVYGRYVLVPEQDWEDIHEYIKKELESQPQK